MAIKSKATLLSDLTSILTDGGLLTALEDRGMRTDFIDSLACLLGTNSFVGNQDITGTLGVSGAITNAALTASRILSSDSSKIVTALDTATYPSLTELAYVKGVTSAIQTQLAALVTADGIRAKVLKQIFGSATSGTGEDTMFTYTIPGGTLVQATPSSIDFEYLVDMTGATGDTFRVRLKLAGTTIYDSTSLVVGATVDEQATIKGRIFPVLTGSAIVFIEVKYNDNTTFQNYFAWSDFVPGGFSWASDNILLLTGERTAGTAAIRCKYGTVKFVPTVSAT